MNAYPAWHFVRIVSTVMILAGLPAVGAAQASDPNALWEASDLFVASWESATLAITVYNPIERPDIDPLTRTHVITVAGNVHILDTNDLIAVSTTHATALQAFDQDGTEVRFDPNAPEKSPGRTWILGDKPKAFSVELHLDPNQAVPTSLSELDFTVEALYGQPFTTIDIPLEVTEEWIELVPRYRIHVEEVNVVDDACHIIIREEITDVHAGSSRSFDPNGHPWEEMSCFGDVLYKFSEFDVVSNAKIVDTDGHPVRGGNRGSSSSGRDGMRTGTRTFTFYNCSDTEDFRIRYTIAMDLYEMPIPLMLTDISVPGMQP